MRFEIIVCDGELWAAIPASDLYVLSDELIQRIKTIFELPTAATHPAIAISDVSHVPPPRALPSGAGTVRHSRSPAVPSSSCIGRVSADKPKASATTRPGSFADLVLAAFRTLGEADIAAVRDCIEERFPGSLGDDPEKQIGTCIYATLSYKGLIEKVDGKRGYWRAI